MRFAGTSLAAACLKNADRLIIAPALLGAAGAGTYGAIAGLASGIALLATPIFTTFLPRFSRLWAAHDHKRLIGELIASSQLCCVMISLPSVAIAACPDMALSWWLGHYPDSDSSRALALLLVATALNVIMQPIYAMQLAAGHPGVMLIFNTIACLWVIPAQLIGAYIWGMTGLAIGWLGFNLIYAVAVPHLASRSTLAGWRPRWRSSTLSIIVTAAIAFQAARILTANISANNLAQCAFIITLTACLSASLLAPRRGPMFELRSMITGNKC
jgi:O-antigen/teichoic acid export membrane protein